MLLMLSLLCIVCGGVAHAVVCSNYTVGWATAVAGSVAAAVNFYPYVCGNIISLNPMNLHLPLNTSMLYIPNATMDFVHYVDLGVVTVNANVTVTYISRSYVALAVYRNNTELAQAAASLPADAAGLVRENCSLVILWMPDSAGVPVKILVNGTDIVNDTTSLSDVLNLAVCSSPVYYFDLGMRMLYLKLPFPQTQEWTVEIYLGHATHLLLNVTSVNMTLSYRPYMTNMTYTTSTSNATVTSITVSQNSVVVSAGPEHEHAVQPPYALQVINGTLVSGTVSDLASQDGKWILVESQNISNTMMIYMSINISVPGYLIDLVKSGNAHIVDAYLYLAGNLSKYVNTRADLIVKYAGQVTTFSNVLNVTSETLRVLDLSSLVTDSNVVSSSIVQLFINVTDVQTYPSTYVNLTLDYLVLKIDYLEKTWRTYTAYITIRLYPGGVNITKIVIPYTCAGSCIFKMELINGTGYTVATSSTSTLTYVGNVGRELTLRIFLNVTSGASTTSTATLGRPIINTTVMTYLTPVTTCLPVTVRLPVDVAEGKTLVWNCYVGVPVFTDSSYLWWINGTVRLYIPGTVTSVWTLEGSGTGTDSGDVLYFSAPSNGTYIDLNITQVLTMRKIDGILYLTFRGEAGGNFTLHLTAPSPYVLLWDQDNMLHVIESTDTYITLPLTGTSTVVKLAYGTYTHGLHVYLNMTNPTAVITSITYKLPPALGISLTLVGPEVIIVRPVKSSPYLVTINGTKYRRPVSTLQDLDLVPYGWYYDPSTETLYIKVTGHSPETVNVYFTAQAWYTAAGETGPLRINMFWMLQNVSTAIFMAFLTVPLVVVIVALLYISKSLEEKRELGELDLMTRIPEMMRIAAFVAIAILIAVLIAIFTGLQITLPLPK